MQKREFIGESDAANLVGLKPDTFRRYVKTGKYSVPYRTRPSGRGFQYDKVAIEKILNQTSTAILK